jgi:16S rRNA (cytidine1402-2'-O)-methyltransferase
MASKGILFLIPNVVAEDTYYQVIPQGTKQKLSGIKHFLAENVRTARRYFSSLQIFSSIEALNFHVLDKDTTEPDLADLMAPLLEGEDIGVVSESGCPGIADPGALAVRFAHRNAIRVIPLVGPSSIVLALMASGLSGQSFAFHGYIPIDGNEATRRLKELEKVSAKLNQTQIVMETPYRNSRFLRQLVMVLRDDTDLCVAVDLTGAKESVVTQTVREWKATSVSLPKLPALFLFLSKGLRPG